MNLTGFPSLLGFVALLFLLLLTTKIVRQPADDKSAKLLLSLLLIGLIALASCTFFFYAGLHLRWPRLTNIEIGLVFWIGPSLYFYVRHLAGGASLFASRLNALHWLPGILVELILVPFYLMPAAEKAAYLASPSGPYVLLIRGIWAGFHVQILIYILICQPLLRVYRQRILDNYADTSRFNLRWLHLLCYGLVGQILVERYLPYLEAAPRGFSGRAVMVSYVLIIALTYLALGQSRLQFAGSERAAPSANPKYRRSGLRDHSARYYLGKLNHLMVHERCYLESDLSLQSLADRLKVSPHHLSQILNEKLGKNFYDYVNELRVEHAKDLLRESQRSITDIGFDSGYNSKNSFYNAFRRHAGMRPSDYRRRHSSPRWPRDEAANLTQRTDSAPEP